MPTDNRRLADLCGPHNLHLQQIEAALHVKIHNRSNVFQIEGAPDDVNKAEHILQRLYKISAEQGAIDANRIHLLITGLNNTAPAQGSMPDITIKTHSGLLRPRGEHQANYLQAIRNQVINFGIGPAGTGKTYLAVASAIDALEHERVQRLVFVRPAVEAGENLGFLPGDLEEKVSPYLRPLYDALYEMLGASKVNKLIEQQVIEIAPLAYMRGRTLSDAFIILDEAQNTTIAQMKMFLTRIGFGSTAVITGDPTQVDLPRAIPSGLRHALKILRPIDKISFTFFTAKDTVRHPLVQDIINAYADDKKQDDEINE